MRKRGRGEGGRGGAAHLHRVCRESSSCQIFFANQVLHAEEHNESRVRGGREGGGAPSRRSKDAFCCSAERSKPLAHSISGARRKQSGRPGSLAHLRAGLKKAPSRPRPFRPREHFILLGWPSKKAKKAKHTGRWFGWPSQCPVLKCLPRGFLRSLEQGIAHRGPGRHCTLLHQGQKCPDQHCRI